jgi:hypothetical protein
MYVLVFVELFDYPINGLAARFKPNNSLALDGVVPRPKR